jgi:formiminotetrahydrofolate cyclodeaminase
MSKYGQSRPESNILMYDDRTPIGQFLDATAARQPTPGGGSIAALAGALSASIGEMVINYSLGKKGLEAYAVELKPVLAEMHRARLLLLGLMVEDQAAYEAAVAARKLPADSPERAAAYPAALLASIRVPQAMVATSLAVLEMCDRIINFVNFHLLSDLAVCSDLAMATARCAVYNVRVNLADLGPAERQQIESNTTQLLSRAASIIQRVSPRIWQRHAQGI